MSIFPTKAHRLLPFLFVLFLGLSCSKDSDLFADHVNPDPIAIPERMVVDDSYVFSPNGPVILDPLENDIIPEDDEVTIIETTNPKDGDVEINEDGTVTYTPTPSPTPDTDTEAEPASDSFTYTIEVLHPDGTITTETGTVTLSEGEGTDLKSYGAVGDGVADDTQAIQEALDSESILFGTPGATYRISGKLDIKTAGNQVIDWNGSKITASSTVPQAFEINKANGVLTMKNLIVEGNRKIEEAFLIQSAFDFDNVDVKNLYSNGSRSVAWRVEVSRELSVSNLNKCDCTNIDSKPNNEIGDVDGVSRCLWLRWLSDDNATEVLVKNVVWDGVWGDDGDIIQVEQSTSKYIHNQKLIIRDSELRNFSRRIIKGTASNIECYNTVFKSPSPTDPRLTSTVPSAGMITMSVFNITNYSGSTSRNHKYVNCTFDNTLGYEGRIIPTRTELGVIEGCTFKRSHIAFNERVGDFEVRNNTFTGNGKIYHYGGTNFFGKVIIDNNTATQTAGSGMDWRAFIELNNTNSSVKDMVITDNLTITNANSGDTVFGLLFVSSVSGQTISNLTVTNNVVIRQGSGETSEMLRIDKNISGSNFFTDNKLLTSSVAGILDIINLKSTISGLISTGNTTHPLNFDYSSLGVGADVK